MRDYRVHSLTILHYGRDYLPYALQSVYQLCDRQFIFYTPHPSHGHRANVLPVETKQDLLSAIGKESFADAIEWRSDKLHWHETDFWNEGQQRDYALSIASRDADLVLTVDYDEVYPYASLSAILDYIWHVNSARTWLLNFYGHFWRSFNWICKDDGWPVRVIDTRHSSGIGYIPRELGPVYHFGYAIRTDVLKYKLAIHGHKDELRPNWLEEKWQAWPPPDDCHPTNGRKEDGTGWWNPEPFDKFLLPELMHSHPYFSLDKIE